MSYLNLNNLWSKDELNLPAQQNVVIDSKASPSIQFAPFSPSLESKRNPWKNKKFLMIPFAVAAGVYFFREFLKSKQINPLKGSDLIKHQWSNYTSTAPEEASYPTIKDFNKSIQDELQFIVYKPHEVINDLSQTLLPSQPSNVSVDQYTFETRNDEPFVQKVSLNSSHLLDHHTNKTDPIESSQTRESQDPSQPNSDIINTTLTAPPSLETNASAEVGPILKSWLRQMILGGSLVTTVFLIGNCIGNLIRRHNGHTSRQQRTFRETNDRNNRVSISSFIPDGSGSNNLVPPIIIQNKQDNSSVSLTLSNHAEISPIPEEFWAVLKNKILMPLLDAAELDILFDNVYAAAKECKCVRQLEDNIHTILPEILLQYTKLPLEDCDAYMERFSNWLINEKSNLGSEVTIRAEETDVFKDLIAIAAQEELEKATNDLSFEKMYEKIIEIFKKVSNKFENYNPVFKNILQNEELCETVNCALEKAKEKEPFSTAILEIINEKKTNDFLPSYSQSYNKCFKESSDKKTLIKRLDLIKNLQSKILQCNEGILTDDPKIFKDQYIKEVVGFNFLLNQTKIIGTGEFYHAIDPENTLNEIHKKLSSQIEDFKPLSLAPHHFTDGAHANFFGDYENCINPELSQLETLKACDHFLYTYIEIIDDKCAETIKNMLSVHEFEYRKSLYKEVQQKAQQFKALMLQNDNTTPKNRIVL